MGRDTAVLAGRRAAERGMVDTCVVSHRTGQTTDPDTGVVTPTYSQLYSGKCRIQHRGNSASPGPVGEAVLYQAGYELQLPMSVTGVAVEDRVTVTASTMDIELAGRAFWVKGSAGGSHKTSRRYDIESVSG